MNQGVPLLTLITFVPLLGALVLSFQKNKSPALLRWITLGTNTLVLLLAFSLWANFDSASGALQFGERHDWIPSLGVQYFLAVDALGLLMVLLSALVVPFAVLGSGEIPEKPHLYFSLMLCIQAGLMGAFTALNFFHWFIFWELILIPAYFLIKLWGGPARTQAATQFLIYTLVGSVTMLLGFVAMYLDARTFDFIELVERRQQLTGDMAGMAKARFQWTVLSGPVVSWLVFAGVFLGFAVKVPLMPFHTWLPAAYTEAPTGVAMVLTGAMSKMGVYGFLRILLPIFPDEMRTLATPLLWLAVGTIILSAFAALAQRDLKRMFAYSSINHLGYCMLGVFAIVNLTGAGSESANEKAAALNGVLLQMFNHGLTASALFCFVGFIERRSGGARGLDQFGGLRKVAPVFCGLMGIALFASLGLPGLNGFVGEFLIFKGAFPLATWATALSVIGLLVTAVFLLTILQRVFSGPLPAKWAGFADLSLRERLIVAPAIALMFLIGIYPQILLGFTNATVRQLLEAISSPLS